MVVGGVVAAVVVESGGSRLAGNETPQVPDMAVSPADGSRRPSAVRPIPPFQQTRGVPRVAGIVERRASPPAKRCYYNRLRQTCAHGAEKSHRKSLIPCSIPGERTGKGVARRVPFSYLGRHVNWALDQQCASVAGAI